MPVTSIGRQCCSRVGDPVKPAGVGKTQQLEATHAPPCTNGSRPSIRTLGEPRKPTSAACSRVSPRWRWTSTSLCPARRSASRRRSSVGTAVEVQQFDPHVAFRPVVREFTASRRSARQTLPDEADEEAVCTAYVLGIIPVVLLVVLVLAAMTGRLRLGSCCAVGDPSKDLRMRAVFEGDDASS